MMIFWIVIYGVICFVLGVYWMRCRHSLKRVNYVYLNLSPQAIANFNHQLLIERVSHQLGQINIEA